MNGGPSSSDASGLRQRRNSRASGGGGGGGAAALPSSGTSFGTSGDKRRGGMSRTALVFWLVIVAVAIFLVGRLVMGALHKSGGPSFADISR